MDGGCGWMWGTHISGPTPMEILQRLHSAGEIPSKVERIRRTSTFGEA